MCASFHWAHTRRATQPWYLSYNAPANDWCSDVWRLSTFWSLQQLSLLAVLDLHHLYNPNALLQIPHFDAPIGPQLCRPCRSLRLSASDPRPSPLCSAEHTSSRFLAPLSSKAWSSRCSQPGELSRPNQDLCSSTHNNYARHWQVASTFFNSFGTGLDREVRQDLNFEMSATSRIHCFTSYSNKMSFETFFQTVHLSFLNLLLCKSNLTTSGIDRNSLVVSSNKYHKSVQISHSKAKSFWQKPQHRSHELKPFPLVKTIRQVGLMIP